MYIPYIGPYNVLKGRGNEDYFEKENHDPKNQPFLVISYIVRKYRPLFRSS